MPQVPVYSSPTVEPGALPNAQMDSGMPLRMLYQTQGAGSKEISDMGNAVEGAAGTLGQVAADQMATVNEAAVKSAHANLVAASANILHDPKTGYLNKLGGDAVNGYDGPDGVAQALKDLPDKFTDGLTNPVQQRLYQQAATQTIQSALNQAQQHAGQQTTKYELDSSAARAGAFADTAVASYNPVKNSDNSAYNTAITGQLVELDSQAQKLGLDGAEYDAYIKQGMTKTHVSLVDHLVSNGQTQGAKDYLDSVRSDLPTAVADKLDGLLKVGAAKDDGINLAIDLGSRFGGNISAQEKELNRMKVDGEIDADTYTITQSQLRAADSIRKGQQAEGDKNFLGSIWDAKRKNPNLSLADLTPQQLNYAKNRNLGPNLDNLLGSNASTDNPTLFLKLMQQAQSDPAGFVNQDIVQFKGQLSDSNFKMLESAYLNINKQDAASLQVDKLQADTVKGAMAQLKASGLNPAAKAGESGADTYAKFEAELHQTLFLENQSRRANGKAPLNSTEARGQLLDLIKDQALAGTGVWGTFQTSGPTYALVDKISDADRATITKKLSAAGMPATPSNIVSYHNIWKGGKAPAKPAQGSGVNDNQD